MLPSLGTVDIALLLVPVGDGYSRPLASTADVNGGAPRGIRLGFPEHLAGDRRGVSLAEQQVAEQIQDRVALRPPEVAVRPSAGRVAQIQEESGDGVRHGRALEA